MNVLQTVQLQDADGEVVAMVDLPATAPTPSVIVYEDIAYERVVDLRIYKATSYLWINQRVNHQRLVDNDGTLVWQSEIITEEN